MSEAKPAGRVRHERHGHVLQITIDNAAKRNAFSPHMMLELSDALTEVDAVDDLWVGVICAEGDHFTAGLDMPKFFGPTASPEPMPDDNVDPFGLRRRCRKPVITAVGRQAGGQVGRRECFPEDVRSMMSARMRSSTR